MSATEQALAFECEGEQLVGIVAVPERLGPVGVLIVVGGPQYRAGSHRQFVHLARRLAREGIAAMRFDYRGMGDAGGDMRSFENVTDDIAAAVAAFRRACPAVERVVLWGLCDAASAALIYVEATRNAPVAGLVLANAWVRSEATQAKTRIKHYYARRLLERDFWARLLRGQVHVGHAVAGVARSARSARRAAVTPRGSAVAFQDRMASGLSTFAGPVLLLMSGRDLTAREFDEYASCHSRWKTLLASASVERRDFEDADHTFSSA
ncbi:MAG TPA: hydrolase 1, exosortase A system-associated, partial [Casimicrobiaceae bacterium]|nr:hydrolase 1, exosortase A system-associated [Casimicrobiaceae bacterium]